MLRTTRDSEVSGDMPDGFLNDLVSQYSPSTSRPRRVPNPRQTFREMVSEIARTLPSIIRV